MKGWLKLDFYYQGRSKKNEIFRAKKWIKGKDERIFRKPVYNQKYEKVSYIKEIFGPVRLPFISIKTDPEKKFNPKSALYVKV